MHGRGDEDPLLLPRVEVLPRVVDAGAQVRDVHAPPEGTEQRVANRGGHGRLGGLRALLRRERHRALHDVRARDAVVADAAEHRGHGGAPAPAEDRVACSLLLRQLLGLTLDGRRDGDRVVRVRLLQRRVRRRVRVRHVVGVHRLLALRRRIAAAEQLVGLADARERQLQRRDEVEEHAVGAALLLRAAEVLPLLVQRRRQRLEPRRRDAQRRVVQPGPRRLAQVLEQLQDVAVDEPLDGRHGHGQLEEAAVPRTDGREPQADAVNEVRRQQDEVHAAACGQHGALLHLEHGPVAGLRRGTPAQCLQVGSTAPPPPGPRPRNSHQGTTLASRAAS
mmetsp:Transcript_11466/g.34800  ORF Transcript_11466/g.34800 Transcript_11466/m.34800 type:complete len:335 (-) Transcript_11466:104-1108(-)